MPERYLGHTLGKYRVDSLLGSGGFAWVFKGYDPELDIPVAIKVLKPQFAGDTAIVERFRREASTAAKLRHPNIIKIYAVGREGDAVYFVMDYLPTGLADKLESSATLNEDYVVRIGIDVAQALGFAHREGVIHRDIKVDNILFDVHGNAVVADFGIARALSGYTQQTGTNMVVGTPQYFAPEQARAKPLDGRADLYSLGVTLYRAATGRLPFEGDDWYEIARQHVEEAPPSPRSIVPTLSPAFEAVVLRCLAKSPEERPATGEQLAEALSLILTEQRDPTLARTLTVPSAGGPTLIAPVDRTPVAARLSSRVPRRVLVPVALVVVVGIAVAAPFIVRHFAAATVPPTTPADSLQDTSSVATVVIPADSAPPDSSQQAPAEVPPKKPPAPVRGTLSVTAPGATITVNGVAVDSGSWRSDTLTPGDYQIVASIPGAVGGCESATEIRAVRVRAGPRNSVTLAPRPCGTLLVRENTGNTQGAEYTVTADPAKPPLARGTLPMQAAVVLPVGRYQISVTKPLCQEYRDDIVIAAGVRVDRPFTFLCPKSHNDAEGTGDAVRLRANP